MSSKFEVVISGISGRFPECDDIATFKKKLYNLDNLITVNNRKWPVEYKYKPTANEYKVPSGTGKYQNVNMYDFRAFKFNHVVGRTNDIINRKVLEPSFEAIVDSGINPFSLDGNNIGVFMSCGITDTDAHYNIDNKGYLFVLSSSKTMQSNRVSFAFNFTGPSYTYQADVLGSMEALKAGYKNVAEGYIDAAIVGVSSNVIDPKLSLQFLAFDFLSPDALCRCFDKNANGYGRSESTVVFFLQRAENAKRNYGSLIFCDTLYYGLNSSTILDYGENILKDSLQIIYNRNNGFEISSKICFMELTGCGVQKLEKIECNAIADIVCKNRNNPLLVGSIKSNIGHTESSAAFVSILKALFALDSGIVAANTNFCELNNKIRAFAEGKLKVVDKNTKLHNNIVAVNSVGITGTVNHAVLKQNPTEPKKNESNDYLPRLLLICGRTKEGLKEAIRKIESLPYNKEFISLTNDAFGSFMPFHIYRGYTILPKSIQTVNNVQERKDRSRPVWFLFSGMGSQWNGMGKQLLHMPVFANIIKKCNAILKSKSIDIYEILTSDELTLFDNIVMAFVGIICVQIGLFEILKTMNINPDGIIGHSVGENACAYADGCLTLEQAILASYERGMASVETKTIKGMMAAIGKGYKEIKHFLPEDIQVACHNSINNCTLTGPADKIHIFIEQLKNDGVFVKTVNVANIAYHSKYIAPAAPQLLSQLKKLIPSPKERSSKWISTSIPEIEWNQPLAKYCSAEYLTNNLVNSVLFEEGCKHIPNNAIVIEIAPCGLLQAILKRSLPETCTNISLTQKSSIKDPPNFFLSSIGELYLAGCEPNINEIFPKITYPVPRGTPSISPYCTWHHEETSAVEREVFKRTEDAPLSSEIIPIRINEDSKYNYLKYHRLGDKIIIPSSLFVYLTWYMFSIKKNENYGTTSVTFENVKIYKNITIAIQKPRFVSIMIQASGNFEVLLENEKNPNKIVLIMNGNISTLEYDFKLNKDTNSFFGHKFTFSHKQIYNAFEEVGYQIDEYFALLQEIFFGETEQFAKIRWNGNWVAFLDSLIKFQIFPLKNLDTGIPFPYSIRKLMIRPQRFISLEKDSEILCYKDMATGRLLCNGLQMEGFTSKICTSFVSNSRVSKIKFKSLKFVSYENPRCQNIAEFINFCLQIVIENMCKTINSNDYMLNLCECNTKYSQVVRTIVKKNRIMKSKIIFRNFKDILTNKITIEDKYFLLLTDSITNIDILNAENSFSIIMDQTLDSGRKIKEPFITITKQIFDQNVFYLLKRKPKTNGRIPKICTEVDYYITRYYLQDNDHEPVFIVKNSLDFSKMFTKRVRDKRRYLYFMDDINELTDNYESLLEFPIVLDLPIAVFKNGEWGSYRSLTFDSDNVTAISMKKKHLKNVELESIRIHIFRVDYNSNDETENEDHSYGIEYSGIDDSGSRIMGLAYINNTVDRISKPDPILLWQIPQEWSFEDAVTVPLIYIQAYHVLHLTSETGFTSSVLINAGKEILFTEACIKLFLSKNFSVFVTFSNKIDANQIRKKFSMLEDFRFLWEDKCQYERRLLFLTRGKGVDVVVNCLSGIEHVKASLNCTGKISYYVEIGKHNSSDMYSLGLYSFLKSVSFITISKKVTSFLKFPKEDKQFLQQQLINGIKCGLVKPFSKTAINLEFTENSNDVFNSKKLTTEYISKIHCNSFNQSLKYDTDHSYIIIAGGERNRNCWIKLVEWLMNKGATKFIIVLNCLSGSLNSSHQLNRILNRKRNSISFATPSNINTVKDAVELIAQANKIAPLEAVYFVLVDEIEKQIRNMDAAAKLYNSNVYFFSLFSGGLNEMESRQQRCSPSLVIHSDKIPKNLPRVFSEIDYLLTKRKRINGNNCFEFYEVIDDAISRETINRLLRFNDNFPKNLETLMEIGYNITKTSMFEERTSFSIPYCETRGIYPIFVIPSIHKLQLDPLLQKLLYPVFCSTQSEHTFSIPAEVSELFESLNSIQPRGPVTLIGETWSSAIAIELSLLIKLSGRKVKLFLLEGDPIQWKLLTKDLDLIDSNETENFLIEQIFNFDLRLNCTESFEIYLNNCAFKSTPNNCHYEYVRKAINVLKKKLIIASNYELKDEILGHVTLFTQNFSQNFSLKLSESSKIIVLHEESYENFIQNPRVISTINNEAMYAWWSNSE